MLLMKFEPVNNNNRGIPLPLTIKPETGCCPASACACSEDISEEFKNFSWFTGIIDTPAGPVPGVSTEINYKEKMRQIKSRISSFRMHYAVKPGLYAAGNPGSASDIFATANYGLSFDHLRKALKGIDAWILVLDTAGINVWCAAGKGTFGTEELIRRIRETAVEKCVDHRRIILPQLGAPGINSGEVKRRTGFTVKFGPVRADDIREYIDNGYSGTPEMRRVKFTFQDRAVLVPMEVYVMKKGFLYLIFASLLYSMLTPEGLIFREASATGIPLIAAGGVSIFAGAVFTPLFLPYIPFRSFILKGGITGAAIVTALNYFTGIFKAGNLYFTSAASILIILLSSYIALQFTGATTYTSLSGVQKEIKYSIPFYGAGLLITAILLILSKASEWGYL
jgi:hypothetical protein